MIEPGTLVKVNVSSWMGSPWLYQEPEHAAGVGPKKMMSDEVALVIASLWKRHRRSLKEVKWNLILAQSGMGWLPESEASNYVVEA